jgi:hypothetical protein
VQAWFEFKVQSFHSTDARYVSLLRLQDHIPPLLSVRHNRITSSAEICSSSVVVKGTCFVLPGSATSNQFDSTDRWPSGLRRQLKVISSSGYINNRWSERAWVQIPLCSIYLLPFRCRFDIELLEETWDVTWWRLFAAGDGPGKVSGVCARREAFVGTDQESVEMLIV